MNKVFIKYVPHGINHEEFYKISQDNEAGQKIISDLQQRLLGDKKYEFLVLYNNRNIRRKMTGDVVLAFKTFFDTLTPTEQSKVALVLHTQPIDENGTDLYTLIRDCAPNINVVFSEDRIETSHLNALYNICDVTINMASNEGFGLGTAESLMAETMIIANVTGGLQDQMGFVNEDGKYLDPAVDFTSEWGSNHDGRYTKCGSWCVPVFPNNRALIGSPPTPYIFDDRCSWEDAAKAIDFVFRLTKEERAERGKLGREYLLSEGFSSTAMGQKFIDGIETVFAQWKPRKSFELLEG